MKLDWTILKVQIVYHCIDWFFDSLWYLLCGGGAIFIRHRSPASCHRPPRAANRQGFLSAAVHCLRKLRGSWEHQVHQNAPSVLWTVKDPDLTEWRRMTKNDLSPKGWWTKAKQGQGGVREVELYIYAFVEWLGEISLVVAWVVAWLCGFRVGGGGIEPCSSAPRCDGWRSLSYIV